MTKSSIPSRIVRYGELQPCKTAFIDAHIAHIRQKLELDSASPQYVITVRGVGYKFEDKSL